MAIESEAIGLRSSRELGDDAKDFVKTDFVLVVYFIPPPLLLDSQKFEISLSYPFKFPYLKCVMPSSCYLLFPYSGHYEGGVVKNLIWIHCTEKIVNGFCIEVKKFLVARLTYAM